MIELVSVLTADDAATFRTRPVPSAIVDLGGIPGDRHHGITTRAGHGQKKYPPGSEVRNRRQLTGVSVEELAEVAARLGIPGVRPEWLGANLLLKGLPDLSHLPPGSVLLFPSGAGLVCEGRNDPCIHPGEEIERSTGKKGLAVRFVKAASHRRGILLTVERAGLIETGARVTLKVPERTLWRSEPGDRLTMASASRPDSD